MITRLSPQTLPNPSAAVGVRCCVGGKIYVSNGQEWVGRSTLDPSDANGFISGGTDLSPDAYIGWILTASDGNSYEGFPGQWAQIYSMSDEAMADNASAFRLRHVFLSLTQRQILYMFESPISVIMWPPIARGSVPQSIGFLIVHRFSLRIVRGSTAFTGGGAIILQYGNTVNGAGTNALDSTIPASVITGAAGVVRCSRYGASSDSLPGAGIYISNKTAAFADGLANASLGINVWYSYAQA